MSDLERRDDHGLPEPRTIMEIARSMIYDGPGTVRDAAGLRKRAAAMVDLARRAGVDEIEYALTARDVERTLGRMIIEGRAAGDLTGHGRSAAEHDSKVVGHDLSGLSDLGVSRDLGARAVAFARVPDEPWDELLCATRGMGELSAASSTAFTRSVRTFLEDLDDQRTAHERRIAAAKADRAVAERARKEAEEEYQRLLDMPAPEDVPPLRPEEVAMRGANIALMAAVPERDEIPALDNSPRAKAQQRLLADMTSLTRTIAANDPTLVEDQFLDVSVLAARDTVQRMVNAATLWLRDLNGKYAKRIGEGNQE